MIKVLLYDIEITPRTLGDSWITMGAANSFLVTFGYRWEHEKKSKYIDLNTTKTLQDLDPFDDSVDELLVHKAHEIMSQADILVAHYGNKFDWKYMNAKFEKFNLTPLGHIPKQDTCFMARKMYKIGSNTLRNLAKYFGGSKKVDIDKRHWLALYCKNKKSMKEISMYCAGPGDSDVNALYDIYQKMRHHFPAVYHVGMLDGKLRSRSCPSCGSKKIIKRKNIISASGTRNTRMSCNSCGKWFQLPTSLLDK